MWTEERLNRLLTEPSEGLIREIHKIDGDIMVLGASGKLGPSLCVLANNAVKAAGLSKKIYAVARFSDKASEDYLKNEGVVTVSCDLSRTDKLRELPDCENIIYLAGKKFGTDGNEWQTWAMNSAVPSFIIDRFRKANYTVFSSGNVYPRRTLEEGGCDESVCPDPNGEYAMSCLARERAFEYAANYYGGKVLILRLNYAVDLRYGVLYDIASAMMNKRPVPLSTPYFNCIWQGYVNEVAIRGLLYGEIPAKYLNLTGSENVSVKYAASVMGKLLGCRPVFGSEGNDSLLSDASQLISLFGQPAYNAQKLMQWQAEWLIDGGKTLDKPTHFEASNGKY